MTHKRRLYSLIALACCLWLIMTAPSRAHWADLATAEITVQSDQAEMALTYPTGLTAFADDDASGQLSSTEINRHSVQLQAFLGDRIQLTDNQRQPATLSIQPRRDVSPSSQAAPSTHTRLSLTYRWPSAVEGIEIDYSLFLPEAPKATCLATISQSGQFTSHVFTPKKTTLALSSSSGLFGSGQLDNGKWALTLIGVFLWGAAHSMSPGHGKTLVGAYLVGERATPRHAVFLALITTLTHTLSVFGLGAIALFAARYILPEQLYPWLSLLSGGMVVAIGIHLLWRRYSHKQSHRHNHSHHHDDHHHHHHDDHHHHGHHHHDHDHDHDHQQTHSHLPAQAGEPVTWRSLALLGLSAGLVPCPAALVLLLGAIALGNPLTGLVLVLFFSLGLSLVLTVLGLTLVYAKQLFKQVKMPQPSWTRWLPVASAVGIVVIGMGISTRSLLQVF
jgi:ABC-type nickel/cobalt efflux system permease component RcnA